MTVTVGTQDRFSPMQSRLSKEFESSIKPKSTPAGTYGGQVTADPTALYQTSLAGLEEWAKSLVQPQDAPAATDRSALDASRDQLLNTINAGPQDFEEFFKTNIQDPSLEAFERDIQPGISRSFAPSGFYSSQRLETDRRANEDLIKMLTRSRGELGYKAEQDRVANALEAGGLAQRLATTETAITGAEQDIARRPMQDLQSLLGVGAAENARVQEDLDRRYQEFVREQNETQRRKEVRDSMLLSALGLNTTDTYAISNPEGPSFMDSFIPGALSAAGSFMGTEGFSNWLLN